LPIDTVGEYDDGLIIQDERDRRKTINRLPRKPCDNDRVSCARERFDADLPAWDLRSLRKRNDDRGRKAVDQYETVIEIEIDACISRPQRIPRLIDIRRLILVSHLRSRSPDAASLAQAIGC